MLAILSVFIVEPTQRLIREPLQTVVQLTCNATRGDLLDITWQVLVGGKGLDTPSQTSLKRLNIILSGDMTSLSQVEINGTQKNSGSICKCKAEIPINEDEFMLCTSEPITVVFYGMYI